MRIVDLHNYRGPHIYCGRRMGPKRPGSPLGNPFKFKDHGTTALARYREWIDREVAAGNRQVLRALREIGPDSVLACWCVSLEGDEIFTSAERCHCQIIWKAWQALRASAVSGA